MGWKRHQLHHMQIICTLLQTDNHASTSPLSFTGQMPFLSPIQQHQSSEGKILMLIREDHPLDIVLSWSTPSNRECWRPIGIVCTGCDQWSWAPDYRAGRGAAGKYPDYGTARSSDARTADEVGTHRTCGQSLHWIFTRNFLIQQYSCH